MIVKLFRNKEVFEASREELDGAKQKFLEEERWRADRAREIGLNLDALPTFNRHVKVGDAYPVIFDNELLSLERQMPASDGCSVVYDLVWPKLSARNGSPPYYGYIPTEVINEAALARGFGFFEEIIVKCVAPHKPANNLMVGRRGKDWYLIAFWGGKYVYDSIVNCHINYQKELAKKTANFAEAVHHADYDPKAAASATFVESRPATTAEMEKAERSWWGLIVVIALVAAVVVMVLGGLCPFCLNL